MNENIENQGFESVESTVYGLRTALATDVEFLFNVSTKAMEPVDNALNPDKVSAIEVEFEKYRQKFIPEEIQIITHSGEDVGRLRVVRSSESIYIGGIQLLPEFQGKGIGTGIFNDLLSESNKTFVPITLEVHTVNKSALNFYLSLGFVEVEQEGNKVQMKYSPAPSHNS